MRKLSLKLIYLSCCIASLSACSYLNPTLSTPPPPATPQPVSATDNGTFVNTSGQALPVSTLTSAAPLGGDAATNMDGIDKSKIGRALDAGIGKSTHWVNGSTGFAYTITPTKKTTVNGNTLCRYYTVISLKNEISHQYNGIACISTDGNWHAA